MADQAAAAGFVTSDDLLGALTERRGPTAEEANQAIVSISGLSANGTKCWLIGREHIGATVDEAVWVDVQGTDTRVRAFYRYRDDAVRGSPTLDVHYTAAGGQRHTLRASITHWARYIVGDDSSLRAASDEQPIEHTCDFWHAFGNPNRCWNPEHCVLSTRATSVSRMSCRVTVYNPATHRWEWARDPSLPLHPAMRPAI